MGFFVQCFVNLDFCQILKISLMVIIYKNLDFGINIRKCSVQIFGNIDIFEKSGCQPIFRNLEFVKFSEILSIFGMFL